MTNSVQIVFTALLHHNIVAIQKLFGIFYIFYFSLTLQLSLALFQCCILFVVV